MALFKFVGAEPRTISRNGTNYTVNPGDIVEMNAEESAVLFKTLAKSHPFPTLPWEDAPQVQTWEFVNPATPPNPHRLTSAMLAASTVLTGAHINKQLRLRHQAPIEVTLPSDPALGDSVQLIFATGASADVTVNPGSAKIDGVSGPRVLTAAEDSLALVWDNVDWKTF